MLPSVPVASVFGVATTIVAVALLIGIAVGLLRAFAERGNPGRPVVSPLERAQVVAVTLATAGLAASVLVDSDVAEAVMVVGVFTAGALAVVGPVLTNVF